MHEILVARRPRLLNSLTARNFRRLSSRLLTQFEVDFPGFTNHLTQLARPHPKSFLILKSPHGTRRDAFPVFVDEAIEFVERTEPLVQQSRDYRKFPVPLAVHSNVDRRGVGASSPRGDPHTLICRQLKVDRGRSAGRLTGSDDFPV